MNILKHDNTSQVHFKNSGQELVYGISAVKCVPYARVHQQLDGKEPKQIR